MLIFSIPLFLAALFAGLATGTGLGFFIWGLGVPLLWSFVYSKALNWFAKLIPSRPGWHFLVSATLVQLALVALLVWAVA